MPSLWVHAAWAPLDLLVELAAAKAAEERLAPLAPVVEMVAEERLAVRLEAWMAEVVDLDPVAAAAVVHWCVRTVELQCTARQMARP